MITSGLKSGCGNQLFSYVITRAVAEHNNYEYGFNPIPEYDFHGYEGISPLSFLNLNYGVQHTCKYDEMPNFVKNIWVEKVEDYRYDNGDYVRYFPYQPEVFDIPDNSRLYVQCCQNALYLNSVKDKIKNWLKIKDEKIEEYENKLKKLGIVLDENLTIIHMRGGDYHFESNILLPRKYYQDAMNIMRAKNPYMQFICVTEDEKYAEEMTYNEVPIVHNSIGCDYYILNNAKNLILSNSSFVLFPTYLNENNLYTIAPRYWWKHNSSNGYWQSSDIFTFGWDFLDRDGMLYDR
jgi:hypothetical protein